MQTVLTTAGLRARDAFEYWYDVANSQLYKHQSEPVDRHNFYAEMQTGVLPDLAMVACKTAPIAGRSHPGDDLIVVLLATRVAMAFGERQFEANGNNLMLLDTREPHFGRALEALEQVGVHIPRRALRQRIPIGKEVVNRPIPIQGDAALLAHYVRMIIKSGPSTLSLQTGLLVCEQVLDLTAAMLGNLTGATPQLGSARRIALRKVRAIIESQLTDLTADRTSIAAAADLSERYINWLLAQEGTSITELLRKRRLAKCREAIEQSNRSINDIAREFGWTLANNFSRDFKQEFGLTPRDACLIIRKK
jgi:AraC-like DNA-binding protein